jgi:hypothetical protein
LSENGGGPGRGLVAQSVQWFWVVFGAILGVFASVIGTDVKGTLEGGKVYLFSTANRTVLVQLSVVVLVLLFVCSQLFALAGHWVRISLPSARKARITNYSLVFGLCAVATWIKELAYGAALRSYGFVNLRSGVTTVAGFVALVMINCIYRCMVRENGRWSTAFHQKWKRLNEPRPGDSTTGDSAAATRNEIGADTSVDLHGRVTSLEADVDAVGRRLTQLIMSLGSSMHESTQFPSDEGPQSEDGARAGVTEAAGS